MSLILSGTNGLSDVDGSAATPAIRGTDANTGMFFPAADTIAFSEGGAEVMRINSSGNVGIGTTNPFYKLEVNGSIQAASNVIVGGTGEYTPSGVTTLIPVYGIGAALNESQTTISAAFGSIGFYTGVSSANMLLNSDGNLGLGVTPSAWSGFSAFQVSRGSLIASSSEVDLSHNAYYDGGNWRYIANGFATNQYQFNGGYAWRTAPSGTAGNTISFTQAMTLDSSGRLLVGRTSNLGTSRLVVEADTTSVNPMTVSNSRSTAATDYSILFYRNGSIVGSVQTSLSATSYVTSSDYRLKEDVQPMTGALAKVAALKPCTYKWKATGADGQGFIAHELQEVVPTAVSGAKDGLNPDGSIKPQGVDTSFLVATLTAAIQEQQAMIEQLKADVAALKGTV